MSGNLGHGHVNPRPDRSKARCGGPAICSVCAREAGVIRLAAIHGAATATRDEGADAALDLADNPPYQHEHLLHLPVPIGGDPFHLRYHQRCACGWDSGPGVRADVRKRADDHLVSSAHYDGEPGAVGPDRAAGDPDPAAGHGALPQAEPDPAGAPAWYAASHADLQRYPHGRADPRAG